MTKARYFLAGGVLAAVLVMACGSVQRPAGDRLTLVSKRLTDETFASDLAVFRAMRERVVAVGPGATGGRRYLATRAAEWLALAQEAYERNDRGAFPEDMLVLAERDIKLLEAGPDVAVERLHSSVLFPSDVRLFDADTWGRALSLRSDADRVGAPDELARAEALLIRQGNPILAGPACLADTEASRRAGVILSAVERTRVNPTPLPPPDTAKQVVPDRPAPVPQPDSAALPRPRGACEAPERLSGVPNSVHFSLDKSSLALASREVLDRAIAKLRDYPGVRVRLSGHTDPRASNAYNLALSQRRVAAVTAYLSANGIGANRILAANAFGEERLLARAIDARNMARNRRVDIAYTLCDGSELVPDETLDDLQLETVRRRARED